MCFARGFDGFSAMLSPFLAVRFRKIAPNGAVVASRDTKNVTVIKDASSSNKASFSPQAPGGSLSLIREEILSSIFPIFRRSH